jgi:ribosomal protein L22
MADENDINETPETPAAEKPKRAAKPKAAAAKADEAATEAKPKRTRAAAKPKAEAKADEAAAEAKPKRTRAAAKPKAEKADAAADAPAEKAEPAKPKAAAKPKAKAEPPAPATPRVVRAQAKYVRSSARKARLVCDHIRGKSVAEARAILAYTPRAVARDWSKVLESAIANAEHNHELDGEDLVIKAAHADEGPTLKRFRPRAMGRATPIRKRTSHLTILLAPKE